MLTKLLKCPNNFVSANFLKSNIDKDMKINSFAFNSGHLELELLQSGHNITVYSNEYYIYEFWRCMINSPHHLLNKIKFMHDSVPMSLMLDHKNNWKRTIKEPYARAAIFYLLNRYSENGSFTRTRIAKENLSFLNLRVFENCIDDLNNIELVYDENDCFTNSFAHFSKDQILMVPAGRYEENLFKHKRVKTADSHDIDHMELKNLILNERQKIILIYKHNKFIENLYDHKIYIDKFGRRVDKLETAEDVIITNFDL